MTAKKYEILRDQTLEHEGRTLYRIRRLSDGQIGGWIEKEENLSHEGDCFIYDDAKAYDEAQVFGDAAIHGKARVFGNAQVYDDAQVFDDAWVCGNAKVFGNANVFGYCFVHGDAKAYEDAKVFGDAGVFGHAHVCGNGKVYDDARVYENDVVTVDAIFKKMPNHNIIVSDNRIRVGCRIHSFKYWENNIFKIGKEHGYSDEMIALYKETIFGFIALRRAQGF